MPTFGYCCIVCVVMVSIASAVERKLFGKHDIRFENMLELSGAVKIIYPDSLFHCFKKCVGFDKCLTFFYNDNVKKCVMHSKDFDGPTLSIQETGWKYYMTRDDTGRCPQPYYYYRQLDFCYMIRSGLGLNFPDIHAECTSVGGRLAAVDSQEKHDYFKYLLANRQYSRIAVGGDRTENYVWTLYNGQQLTYFDWYPGDPSNVNSLCLQLKTNDQLFDCSCGGGNDRMYICET